VKYLLLLLTSCGNAIYLDFQGDGYSAEWQVSNKKFWVYHKGELVETFKAPFNRHVYVHDPVPSRANTFRCSFYYEKKEILGDCYVLYFH
jgi:hypothetical protein